MTCKSPTSMSFTINKPQTVNLATTSQILSSKPRMAPFNRPQSLSSENLKRSISDITFEMSKPDQKQLAPISEVEDAKCECCGMSEECTSEYIERVRNKFSGKWVCGLCAEAVKEEMKKIGGGGGGGKKLEEALKSHMSACYEFNKVSRAYPVLVQAEAMREMMRKNKRRANSISPREGGQKKSGMMARSSSCIPAITRDIVDLTLAN